MQGCLYRAVCWFALLQGCLPLRGWVASDPPASSEFASFSLQRMQQRPLPLILAAAWTSEASFTWQDLLGSLWCSRACCPATSPRGAPGKTPEPGGRPSKTSQPFAQPQASVYGSKCRLGFRWHASSATAVAAAAKEHQHLAVPATLWGELEAFGLPIVAVDFSETPRGATAADSPYTAGAPTFSRNPRDWRLGKGFWGAPARGPPSDTGGTTARANEAEVLLEGPPKRVDPRKPVVGLLPRGAPQQQQWLPLAAPPMGNAGGPLRTLRRLLLRLLHPRQQRQRRQAAAAAATLAALEHLPSSSDAGEGRTPGKAQSFPKWRPRQGLMGPPASGFSLAFVQPDEPFVKSAQGGPLMFTEGPWGLASDVLLLAGRGCSFWAYDMFAAPQQQQVALQLLSKLPDRRSRLQRLRSRHSGGKQQHLLDAWGFPQWPAYAILAHIHKVLNTHREALLKGPQRQLRGPRGVEAFDFGDVLIACSHREIGQLAHALHWKCSQAGDKAACAARDRHRGGDGRRGILGEGPAFCLSPSAAAAAETAGAKTPSADAVAALLLAGLPVLTEPQWLTHGKTNVVW
ncbi:uncharacterized protein LOC34620493 [Cyclospora cayetanensis]|uniref:Uncharacterized protein LOC34620493 n=1 Tax=Cyclospora cayetanensis TaxID=88456 RepID=A0A6P6S247_9EIME|nr:uncharacterized protein LOC34620493 [Cyclospora cayetanensis]